MTENNLPKVSVIMNCYNCSEYLREAIDSVFAQTFKNWEIIFWDNASTDTSAEIAQSYDNRLHYFKGETTVDIGAARNLAVAESRGDFIAFLDCDDIWLKEKLAKQLLLFEDPEVGLVYCDVEKFNQRGDSVKLSEIYSFASGHCFSELLTGFFLSLPAVIVRRDALSQEETLFNERFTYMEDFDLFTRIAYRWKLAWSKEVLARYRVHSTSLTVTRVDEVGYVELQEILNTFRLREPDFERLYKKEIYKLETIIAYNNAYSLWKNKRGTEARKVLKKYFFTDTICTLVYLCTYLPFFNIKKFRKKFLNRYDTVLP